MKKISNVWTVVFKENGCEPLAYSYTSGKDAIQSKTMIENSNGQELINEKDQIVGRISLEWCYLINGKLIEPIVKKEDE
ncbi:hypothetical protein MOF05_20810 [Bacillus haynesii]|uniref:hypothetical protein n=1 Tax=Bacillus haynesii TaxID=1925021 RepID=UPI00228142FE|nr:hypothetical protein [Bacillus haynesii]MCY9290794.1 hypothetical protein [Bacillus haynesii]